MRRISRRTSRPPSPAPTMSTPRASLRARKPRSGRSCIARKTKRTPPSRTSVSRKKPTMTPRRRGHADVADARRLRHRLDERDVAGQQQRGDDDALADLHEVARAHVAPLALVEAEEGEDDQAHRDERPDRRLQEVLVALRDPACEIAEAQPVGEEVGKGDQHPVDHELRERVAVQREGRGPQPPAHPRDCRRKAKDFVFRQSSAERTAATTSPTCSSVSAAPIGSARWVRAASSVPGRTASRPRSASAGWRCAGTE